MRKGEQTRQDIIRKAAPLFNQHGYEGAALSDLMKATGLEKGGLSQAGARCSTRPSIPTMETRSYGKKPARL